MESSGVTSSKTTRTGMTSLSAWEPRFTTFPVTTTFGSSSNDTWTTLYGTWSLNCDINAWCTQMNEKIMPVPPTSFHSKSSLEHCVQFGDGGKRSCPQSAQHCTTNSCRLAASQKAAVAGSGSGSGPA